MTCENPWSPHHGSPPPESAPAAHRGAGIDARSDCKAVVIGFAAGSRSEHSGNALAELWSGVIFAIEFKQLTVTVTKEKAHTSEADVASGLIRGGKARQPLRRRAGQARSRFDRLPKEVVDDLVAKRQDLINLTGFLGEVVEY